MADRVKQVLKDIHDVVKEDRIISRLLPRAGLPYGDQIAAAANALGYGRRRGAPKKRMPKKRGKGAEHMFDADGEPITVYRSATGAGKKKRAPRSKAPTKRGKGFGDFLKGLIQAPLAGVAATAGGLHGALGGFGRRKRGGRKMLAPTHAIIKL